MCKAPLDEEAAREIRLLLEDNTRLGEIIEDLGEYKARWVAAQRALDQVAREGSEVIRISAVRQVLRHAEARPVEMDDCDLSPSEVKNDE